MKRSLLKRSLVGLGIVLLSAVGTVVAAPATPAQITARPDFEMPFPCGEIWNGATYSNHGGAGNYYPLDFNWGSGDDDRGRPVHASAAGVARLGSAAAGEILIDHGGGWTSQYRHLERRVIASGTQVAQGQLIGNVGDIGNSSGPHLHYAQLYNGTPVHIELHGQLVTYSFNYNGPPFESFNTCSGRESVNGDQYDDVLAVDPGNVMRVFPGNASGGFGTSTALGGGWSSAYNRIAVGDTNADGHADILATSTDGRLHYWHNSGSGAFSKLTNSGVGWTSIEWFAMVDVNRDKRADIVARDGGILYWYPGRGAGAFDQRIRIGEGWATYPEFAGADADGDGDGDLWATDAAGNLSFWRGSGAGTFSTRQPVGSGWNGFGPFNALDVNGDNKADLVAVRTSDGKLFRWTGKGDGTFNQGAEVGHGWTGYRMASY
ncbi:VCBS repeat domain-containing M23 family metallopeptidase [Kribbella sp. NBC_01245]|uniref:VCBS repeat domain-containing M23 family metallopeptidase n=1 Tax=Kribbella sp. NBC_01245 TaxID=2903578 RepID=UPI002E2877D1|nr:VCBS repeat domain-containing M23 family metallopeptidase [Kribbella sp. NBC_01245]